jgi:hypothetical protein
LPADLERLPGRDLVDWRINGPLCIVITTFDARHVGGRVIHTTVAVANNRQKALDSLPVV